MTTESTLQWLDLGWLMEAVLQPSPGSQVHLIWARAGVWNPHTQLRSLIQCSLWGICSDKFHCYSSITATTSFVIFFICWKGDLKISYWGVKCPCGPMTSNEVRDDPVHGDSAVGASGWHHGDVGSLQGWHTLCILTPGSSAPCTAALLLGFIPFSAALCWKSALTLLISDRNNKWDWEKFWAPCANRWYLELE